MEHKSLELELAQKNEDLKGLQDHLPTLEEDCITLPEDDDETGDIEDTDSQFTPIQYNEVLQKLTFRTGSAPSRRRSRQSI